MGLFGSNKNTTASNRPATEPAPTPGSPTQGLDDLTQESTVADLMREKGQRRRVKVMKESALRGFIAEAIESVIADHRTDSHLTEDREALATRIEERLQGITERAKRLDEERQTAQELHDRLCVQLDRLARDHRGDAEFCDALSQWRQASQTLLDDRNNQHQAMAKLHDDVDRIGAALRR